MAFDPVGKEQSPQVYPNSLMGALAVIRQAFIDTGHAEEKSQYLKQKTSTHPTSHMSESGACKKSSTRKTLSRSGSNPAVALWKTEP